MTVTQLKAALVLSAAAIVTGCQAQGSSPIMASRSSPSLKTDAGSGSQQSVAYQIDAEHTGFARGPLKLPLKKLWRIDLGGSRGNVGYPIIANGIVVVTAAQKLIALDEKTGKKLWTQVSPTKGTEVNGWLGPAYDDGMIFVSPALAAGPKGLGMYAFDERTGAKLWSAPSPGAYGFSSPPTAVSGVVYAGGSGGPGTVYAYDESSGALKWTAPVENGDDSSPVVTRNGVFVSYACPQTYDFRPSDGKQIWHFAGPCEGGGGSTPVLYNGLLYVEDIDLSNGYTGLILHASDGTIAEGFDANHPPAFARNVGFFIYDTTLEARTIPTMKRVWKATIATSEGYATPPLVVGNIVYVGTATNYLVGYGVVNGKEKVNVYLGNGGYSRNSSTGLAFGDGELIVPNGSHLIAFQGS
jgi:outer membrane protein assembly factor BamB